MQGVLEILLILFLVFILHRALAFRLLLEGVTGGNQQGFQAFLVGSMSDCWVACVLATLLGIVLSAPAVFVHFRLSWWLPLGVAGISGIFAAVHQAYIEFFKFPIVPFHLHYLTDRSFMSANAASLLGSASVVSLVAPLVVAVGLRGTRLMWFRRVRTSVSIFIGLLVLGLVSHNRNIHYREQWFIPENLQVNPLERLYMQLTSDKHPKSLALEEMAQLEALMGRPSEAVEKVTRDRLFSVLTRPLPVSYDPPKVAATLKHVFDSKVKSGLRPVIMVALLESLRPSETGYFSKDKGASSSLTPHIDALVRHGIVFYNAFSTGSVTRGAQEAVLCGYLGSRDTSLMRGSAVASLDCLTQAVASESETFWYHGGDARFDQQAGFWSSQGVKNLMALHDFSTTAVRTSWGIGDETFYRAAGERLESLRSSSQSPYLLGMVLSLSNHIPWELPQDYPIEFDARRQVAHPSYLTSAYADHAFGDFVQTLKKTGTWADTLMIVSSDHGNQLTPSQNLYADLPSPQARLQSHVNFFLVGGLVEDALRQLGREDMALRHPVSQADIAVLIADILGIRNRKFFGENPFIEKRDLPVLSILEDGVFSPVTGETFQRSDLGQGVTREGSRDSLKTQLYYRAFMQFIGMPSPHS
jgi:phosphoglycerol transferase MdoB-like AlkP superfamily enzyme